MKKNKPLPDLYHNFTVLMRGVYVQIIEINTYYRNECIYIYAYVQQSNNKLLQSGKCFRSYNLESTRRMSLFDLPGIFKLYLHNPACLAPNH